MADVTSGPAGLLRKKVVGVPVLYIAGAAAVFLAVLAWRAQQVPSQNDTPDAEATDLPAEPDFGGALLAGSGESGTGFNANPVPTYDNAIGNGTTVDTNEAWIRRSAEWLAGQGLIGGAEAQRVMNLYVNGEPMSFAQGELRDAAIKQFGLPPENINPGTTGARPTDPGKAQGPTPLVHVVKNTNEDGYRKLIALYYGTADQEQKIDLLQAANTNLGSGGPWPVGTRVNIPKYHAPKYYTSTKTTNTASEIAKKNGISTAQLYTLNDGKKFPVKSGTKLRVA